MALVDVTLLPLVVVTFPASPSAEELEEAVAETRRIFARNERVAFVVDVGLNVTSLDAARRLHLRHLMASIQEDADRLMLGAAYVASSPATRGVLTALQWARGARPYPVKIVSQRDEAVRLAREWIASSGKT